MRPSQLALLLPLCACTPGKDFFRPLPSGDSAAHPSSDDSPSESPADDSDSPDSPVDTGSPTDADADGFTAATDCDDADAAVYPGAAETCDGVDNDCDGALDPSAPANCPSVNLSSLREGGGLVAVTASGFALRDEGSTTNSLAIVAALEAFLPRVSVSEVLDNANRAATRLSSSRAAGFEWGFSWNSGDEDVAYWFPQGVTGTFDASPSGLVDGRQAVVVSWHYEPEDAGTTYDKGVRLSFADVANPSDVNYRHVLLVAPSGSASAPNFAAVPIHAGGIAWVGDWLYVADTGYGLRVFDTTHILEVSTGDDTAIGCSGSACQAYNYRYVLPQVTRWSIPACGCDTSFSFVSLDQSTSPPSLVTGTYSADSIGELVIRWPLDPSTLLPAGTVVASEAYVTQQDRVQGALAYGGAWWLSCSSQSGAYGLLYRTRPGAASTSYTWVDGPEDLALDSARGLRWSATEDVGDRAVVAVRLSGVGG